MAEITTATLTWTGGARFVAHTGSGHELVTESVARPGHQGASPMELLLVAVAGCTAIDVAAILEKMREPVAAIAVAASGTRAASHPKYFTAIELVYTVRGAGVSREKVERAVSLSHSTYCSASASLRPDCAVTTRIVIEDV
jgi:putative redox protein